MPSNAVVHVIDDDDAARDSLAFLLRAAQIDVRTYETAPAFLATIKPLLPGCVITDVRMPEMTGIELLRRLRESGIDIPVIVITGHGDIPLAVEAMKYGAADFFEKPFDDDALLKAVRSALNRLEGAAQKIAERAALNERWQHCPPASARFLKAWWRESPIRSLPSTMTSALARLKSIAPM